MRSVGDPNVVIWCGTVLQFTKAVKESDFSTNKGRQATQKHAGPRLGLGLGVSSRCGQLPSGNTRLVVRRESTERL